MSRELFSRHIQHIFDSLQVGLDNEDNVEARINFPKLADIDPDRFNRGMVDIEGQTYTVSVFAATAPAECPKSTHGKHTPVDGTCIGCGEKVS